MGFVWELYTIRPIGTNRAYRACAYGKGGTIHCDPRANLRVSGGRIRRGSAEWKVLYRQRQAIERTFKSLKQSRRLERHYTRGHRQIALHALMATIIYQATALGHLQAGGGQDIRWQVERVA